jgi:hypothetical protein
MSSASIWAVAGDAGIRSVLLCSTWAERAKVAIVSVTESEASRSKFPPMRERRQDHQQDRP